MAALGGLKGLYPDPQDTTDTMDEGVLEAKGNAPNSEHGMYGSQSDGYSGTIPTESPYGGMSVYDGYDYGVSNSEGYVAAGNTDVYGRQVGGQEYDITPTTHSSPTPRIGQSTFMSWENPSGPANIADQMNMLHGPDLGGVKFHSGTAPPGHEEPTHYTTDRYDAPNENYLAPEVPGQLKSFNGFNAGGGKGGSGGGGSNADTTQGYGELNDLPEFQMGHSIRRVQHDHMPWDYTNTHGEQDVPFPGKHPVQQMPLDGPDSPYFEGGDINGANIPWEGRIGDPTAYVQPPEVTTLPASSQASNDYYPALSF